VEPELTQSVTVQKGGKIELIVPSLSEGAKVNVSVWPVSGEVKKAKRPGYGADKGRICLAPDFDEPLDDFAGYR
jgi:hypothetical protein